MKKLFALPVALMIIFAFVACSNGNNAVSETSQPQTSSTTEDAEDLTRVASDGAQRQTLDPTMATRVLENGTKINMHFGDIVIPGTLNDSITAQALISKLPYTVHVNRYSHDFCGVMDDPLEYREEDVHYGWLNGDIDFATDADYFTILFEDEEKSEQYGYQVNIGKIDSELSVISQLSGSYDVLIELAE
ncbi:cyclophilin-like fold protein [Paenibacillus sp. IHBB 3054]|uniref:cyclophilin-like fold protein n=1 Tax=Paenibacillus sp. IHBB 3054 TaxID=3425689 RepID=UPI003F67639E